MAILWLKRLLELQALDMRKNDLELRLTLLPKEMNSLLAKRDKINAGTVNAANRCRKIELDIKNTESAVAAMQAENLKLQQQSALVKKNNEYQAMLNAVESNRKKIGELEEKLIVLMDDFEAAKIAYRKTKTANDAEIKNLKAEFDELFAFSGAVKKEIAAMTAKRPEMLYDLNEEMFSRYTALLKGRDRSAPIVKLEDGCCSNCHMKATPQTVNALKKGEVLSCDNCQHIIYDPVAAGLEDA